MPIVLPAGTGITGGHWVADMNISEVFLYVYALTVYNGELIAGGGFTKAGGIDVNNIARWDGNAGSRWAAERIIVFCSLTVYQRRIDCRRQFHKGGGR